jgi:hypothetical protein
MKTINELKANMPIQVVIDFHIQNNSEVQLLESRINAGELSAIEELEITIAWILENEIENFAGKENFSSSFLRRMKMLVRTKQICAQDN